MDLDFLHLSFEMNADDEISFSPHFSPKETKEKLASHFSTHKKVEYSQNTSLPDDLLLLANEAFPESAINDPLGDLQVWESWQTGSRTFPYPGQYIPLDIFGQGAKVQSPTAIGVIGECLTGLFATAGIAPLPVVRPIRRWPDFILYDRSKSRFALLESKAFTDLGGATTGVRDRISDALLGEFLFDALQHLLSDRTVAVWGAFTRILSITPFKAQVTFIETSLENNVQQGKPSTTLSIIGNFVMQLGLNSLVEQIHSSLNSDGRGTKKEEFSLDDQAISSAFSSAMNELTHSFTESMSYADRDLIIRFAKENFKDKEKKIKSTIMQENFEQPAYRGFSNAAYEVIRKVGDVEISGRRLTSIEASALDKSWLKNWDAVGQKEVDAGSVATRCGGLFLTTRHV